MWSVRGTGRAVVTGFACLLLMAVAGCKSSSATKATPDASGPAPVPVSAPPPSLREAGAQIADEATLKQLVPGKTTKTDVRDRFGMPQEVVLSSNGETFIYSRDRTSGLFRRTTERLEMLTVRFDGEGRLKDFEYRFAGK